MSGLPSPAPGCAPCAARDAEIAALRVQLAEPGERVARMERAASGNSGNSSMPPSRRPPAETQQKISGRLTSEDATQDRLGIRSCIDTARKHGHDAMTVLRSLFTGTPWHPPEPAAISP